MSASTWIRASAHEGGRPALRLDMPVSALQARPDITLRCPSCLGEARRDRGALRGKSFGQICAWYPETGALEGVLPALDRHIPDAVNQGRACQDSARSPGFIIAKPNNRRAGLNSGRWARFGAPGGICGCGEAKTRQRLYRRHAWP